MIAHEAPLTNGFGAEIAATIQVLPHCQFINIKINVMLCILGGMFFAFGSPRSTSYRLGYSISTCL